MGQPEDLMGAVVSPIHNPFQPIALRPSMQIAKIAPTDLSLQRRERLRHRRRLEGRRWIHGHLIALPT